MHRLGATGIKTEENIINVRNAEMECLPARWCILQIMETGIIAVLHAAD